jgi:hypothetical protein
MDQDDRVLYNVAERWIMREINEYVREKFTRDDDIEHIKQPDLEWWQQQFDTYLHRAKVLGLDSPGGQQAIAKFAATAVGMFMAMLKEYQYVPAPGVSSGNHYDDIWTVRV